MMLIKILHKRVKNYLHCIFQGNQFMHNNNIIKLVITQSKKVKVKINIIISKKFNKYIIKGKIKPILLRLLIKA